MHTLAVAAKVKGKAGRGEVFAIADLSEQAAAEYRYLPSIY
jgi:hypothetical protein